MKHGRRGARTRKPIGLKPGHAVDAFGAWLQRSLRSQYEPVLHEPIPQGLLDMIEADRLRRQEEEDGSPPGAVRKEQDPAINS